MYGLNGNSYPALAVCLITVSMASATLLSEMIPPPAGLISSLTECRDFSNFCPKGKSFGYCDSLIAYVKNFMHKYCKKTCSLCPGKPTPPPCIDKSTYCIYGKKVGQCESKNLLILNYMKKNCKKSCDFCKGDECSDSLDHLTCTKYKREGKCDTIAWRSQMETSCKKTCKLCDLSKSYPCGISKITKLVGRDPVVGGKETKKGVWPWQAAIWIKGSFKCGGTLVNRRFVITAAHCITSRNALDYKVVFGDHNRLANENTEQIVGGRRVTVHPKYVPRVRNDIAIIEVDQDAILTTYITPACLPSGTEEAPAGTKCFITGWGKMHAGGLAASVLQEAPLHILDESQCRRRRDDQRTFYRETMLCARNPKNVFSSGCHGDSGGPLVCENAAGRMVLQGVVSWGSSTCDALERATVFTRVGAFLPWIKKIIGS